MISTGEQWTLWLGLEGKGAFSFKIPVPPGATILEMSQPWPALEAETRPQVAVQPALDPCVAGLNPDVAPARWRWHLEPSTIKITAKISDPQYLELQGVASERISTTQPLVLKAQGQPTFTWAATHAPPGRAQRLQLWLPGVMSAVSGHELPAASTLPELAFEEIDDTWQAVTQHLTRRDGPGWLRIFAGPTTLGPMSRFLAQQSRDRLAPAPKTVANTVHQPRWIFRRVWRAPLACGLVERYANVVTIQQKSETMAYAALTGRSPGQIIARNQARGYVQNGAERQPVEPRIPPTLVSEP